MRKSDQELSASLKIDQVDQGLDFEVLLSLERQICFNVYSISRAMTNLYRSYLTKIDLTYPNYLVMLILWERRQAIVREIGDLLYLDTGTLSPLLKRLEGKGFLTRSRDSADERQVVVMLTEKGQALREKAREIPIALKCALDLPSGQADRLRSDLRSMFRSLSPREIAK